MFISSILSLFGQNQSCVKADPIVRDLIVLMRNPSAYKQTIFIDPSDQILFMGIGDRDRGGGMTVWDRKLVDDLKVVEIQVQKNKGIG